MKRDDGRQTNLGLTRIHRRWELGFVPESILGRRPRWSNRAQGWDGRHRLGGDQMTGVSFWTAERHSANSTLNVCWALLASWIERAAEGDWVESLEGTLTTSY